jgi:hypothetical protein
MTDRPTDRSYIEKLCEVSGACYFDDSIRLILEEVIKELFYSHQDIICNLRPNHVSRAIFKYRQAKEKTCIWNTKQYFKACVVSAIREAELDELEPIAYEEWE